MLRATLKSLLARKLRLVLSGLAVVLGVMFVSGAFVLTDTLGRSFDNLFANVYADTDVAGRGEAEGRGRRVRRRAGAGDRAGRRWSTGSTRCPGWPRRPAMVVADGARVIGKQRQGRHHVRAAALRRELDRRERACVQLREGRGPTADDEIAINAGAGQGGRVQGRRPGRRADPAAEADVHRRRHLRVQRRPGLPRRRARGRRSPSRWRSS